MHENYSTVNGDNASISVSYLFQPQAQGECGGEQGLPKIDKGPDCHVSAHIISGITVQYSAVTIGKKDTRMWRLRGFRASR